jgi:hypothetical protein
MATTTFVAGTTVEADWLNDVNTITYTFTGTGSTVKATSPTLVTPVLGVATATSVNKNVFTTPATSATWTLVDGKTLTCSNTLTFTGTDGSSVAFGAGGTVTYTANKLSVFAATSSAELAGVISDETGSGALVFATDPTFTLTDVTTNNVSATAHGWAPKFPNNTTTFLRGDGTYAVPAATGVGDHEVVVTTGNGYGSTNTTIRRFTTTLSSVGTAITYADSAANGASFTINETGIYAIRYSEQVSTGADRYLGASVNSSQLTSIIQNITAANRLFAVKAPNDGTNLIFTDGIVVKLTATDVVRPHCTLNLADGSVLSVFSIRKIGLV